MRILVYKHREKPLTLKEYFHLEHPYLNFSLLQKWLRKGEIKVNGRKVSHTYNLVHGDKIKTPPLHFFPQNKEIKNEFESIESVKRSLNEILIHEEDDYMVLNKPSGLAVQGGTNVLVSVDRWLQVLNKETSFSELKFRLVHRIDKETSGILVLAKNYQTAKLLTQAFREHSIEKKYLAITQKIPYSQTGEHGVIENHLIKDYFQREGIEDDLEKSNFEKIRLAKKGELGQHAVTKWKLLKSKEGKHMIELIPLTGRKHQLRVHLSEEGCPILGDSKYRDEIKNKKIGSKKIPLLLHAYQITLPMYEVTYTARIPEYFPIRLEEGET